MEGFYCKEGRTRKENHQQGKNESSLEESKSARNDGFLLAELQVFSIGWAAVLSHSLSLLLGGRKSPFP